MARALLSVSDKTGIVELAQKLHQAGIELVSTGGTYKTLAEAGLPVLEVAAATGFPEMMDGRVKTLHPKIHGGLLALRDDAAHMQAAAAHGIEMIDVVVVNLYPFAATIAKPDVTLEEAVENIDIGGPGMLRAAAKNHRFVTVLVDPEDYDWVGERLAAGGAITAEEKFALAAKVFRHTAAYDARIAGYLTEQAGIAFPETLTLTYDLAQPLRYGENPHQQAAFYKTQPALHGSLASAVQLQGKELSYNNIQDADAALAILAEFGEPTAVAVKHMNPCGVGTGDSIHEAYERAYAADPVSIFGGIVALNRAVDETLASKLAELFLEIIIAPEYTEAALAMFAKKKNLRVLTVSSFGDSDGEWSVKGVRGGLLLQERDVHEVCANDLEVVTAIQPTMADVEEMLFAWKVVKHVKSNAIVITREGRTIGVGAGQMNRVGAAEIALRQAGELANGAILASDAFFPMPDTVEVAAKAGVRAIIQPGGSIRDKDSIAEANRHGIAMVFTKLRHFKH